MTQATSDQQPGTVADVGARYVSAEERFVEHFFHRRVPLRCDGKPATMASRQNSKRFYDVNRNERAIGTLAEQVREMRLDFEERTGSKLTANSSMWLGKLRNVGRIDARFQMKLNEAAPYAHPLRQHVFVKGVPAL